MDRASGFQGRKRDRDCRTNLRALITRSPELAARLAQLRKFSRKIRTSEYHVTNKCNLRCRGCWFYEYGFDREFEEVNDLRAWERFARNQAANGITHGLLIGGEPTLFLDRIQAFVRSLPYVTVSTNGLHRIPQEGFSRVAIAISLFGGLESDDQLRGRRPSGSRVVGLLGESLKNYKGDKRATFIYALTPDSVKTIEGTVEKIAENGNRVTFNYYSAHGSKNSLTRLRKEILLEEAIRVKHLFPEVVTCDEFYIRTLILGSTAFGKFGYEVCPSISISHPLNRDRVESGNPVLPHFNVYSADLKTLAFCCTSGRCDSCRDSQAVYSWLLLAWKEFVATEKAFREWLDLAEGYWSQFVWSPYHWSTRASG